MSTNVKKADWVKISPHPTVYIILGDVGTGKTYTGCSIMDRFHRKNRGLKFYMLAPKDVVELYPDWIKPLDPSKPYLPQNSLGFIDDAHLFYYNRDWQKTDKILDYVARERRHTGNSIVLNSQQGRAVDVALISMGAVVIIFRYSKLQYRFERKEIKDLIDISEPALKSQGYKKGICYVFGPDYEGLVKVPKVTWFNDKISKAHKRSITNQAPKKDNVKSFTDIIKVLGRSL